jgi:ribosomal protein S18 acetylase RimI-like enzyme
VIWQSRFVASKTERDTLGPCRRQKQWSFEMSINVRQIREADKSSWLELYLAYLRFYNASPDDMDSELLWDRLTNSDPQIQGLVAESNGIVVGIAHFHYQLSTWSDTSHCYLEDLYVAERARENGVAKALIQQVQEAAIKQGCTELFWITKESNSTARKLYDKVANLSDFIRYEKKL